MILAGGASSRFGSDKALAVHAGKPLIAHVADALVPQCSETVICGRQWGGFRSLDDRPASGLGPMGGLAAGLAYGESTRHTHILCAPCDIIGLPADASALLAPGPTVVENQWLVGFWPSHLASLLNDHLEREGPISARRWAEIAQAQLTQLLPLKNINRPEDLKLA